MDAPFVLAPAAGAGAIDHDLPVPHRERQLAAQLVAAPGPHRREADEADGSTLGYLDGGQQPGGAVHGRALQRGARQALRHTRYARAVEATR